MLSIKDGKGPTRNDVCKLDKSSVCSAAVFRFSQGIPPLPLKDVLAVLQQLKLKKRLKEEAEQFRRHLLNQLQLAR